MLENFRYICIGYGFRRAVLDGGMKRESGENPEQSRCCESSWRTENPATDPLADWEGFGAEESQKTCRIYSTSGFLVG